MARLVWMVIISLLGRAILLFAGAMPDKALMAPVRENSVERLIGRKYHFEDTKE